MKIRVVSNSAVEALDLPGRGWMPGLRQKVLDSVQPADPVEQHFHWRLREAAGEDLAVVGEDLLRDPVRLQGRGEAVADQLGPLPRHESSRYTEPGVVVNPGQSFGRGPVRQQEASHRFQVSFRRCRLAGPPSELDGLYAPHTLPLSVRTCWGTP